MYQAKILINIKTHDREKEKVFESTLYKDCELPFLPTLNMKISFDDVGVLPPVQSIVWNASGNYFVCRCANEIGVVEIGKFKEYAFHDNFARAKYKNFGWMNFEIDDDY